MNADRALTVPIRRGIKGRVRKDLRISTADGVAYSVMLGASESFIPLFALTLGYGDVLGGLVTTVPMVAAAILQLITPYFLRRVGSYKRVVVTSVSIQTLAFVPLIIGALAGALPGWLLFIAAAMNSLGGVAGGPAWTTWIGLLVPTRVRAHYFAGRARWLHGSVLAGILACGYMLRGLESFGEGWAVRGFAIVFGIAAIARGISLVLLSCQGEVRPLQTPSRPVTLADFLGRLVHGPDGRLVAFVVAAQFAAQIAQPYFIPYMKSHLHYKPDDLAMMVTALYLGRILVMPALGRIAKRAGDKRVLWLAWAGLIPIPLYWLVSDNFVWLFVSQLAAGAAWGAFEYANQLMFIAHVPEPDRPSVMSWYNLMNALAFTGGSLIGAAALAEQHAFSGYVALFVASAIARVAIVVLLVRVRANTPDSR